MTEIEREDCGRCDGTGQTTEMVAGRSGLVACPNCENVPEYAVPNDPPDDLEARLTAIEERRDELATKKERAQELRSDIHEARDLLTEAANSGLVPDGTGTKFDHLTDQIEMMLRSFDITRGVHYEEEQLGPREGRDPDAGGAPRRPVRTGGCQLMQETNIAWTDTSWNPTHGCSKVSAGCGLGEDGESVGAGCYAERISRRYDHTDHEWTNEHAAENVAEKPHKLEEPYRLGEPQRVFVDSMSDLFHSEISEEYIREVFGVMRNCPEHVFQVLTKRPGRAAHMTLQWPENVWIGTSVEDERVTDRLDLLRDVEAETRFVSFEPLIGPIEDPDLSGFAWAIVGGESGPNYREMAHEWVWPIMEACREQEVAFFFKQSSGARPETGTALRCPDAIRREFRELPDLPESTLRARSALQEGATA